MASKYFKIILHKNINGGHDYSYIDIESSGRVSTCFSNVRLSKDMMKMPKGIYRLKIVKGKYNLILYAYRGSQSFEINFNNVGASARMWLWAIEYDHKTFSFARLQWQRIHRETYLAMRDHYPATIEIIDE